MTHIDADDVSRLRAAIGRLSRQLNASVADIGFSPSQLSVLGTVARRGPIGIGELAELEGINPTMLSRIVGKLSDADLIERIADPDDGRAVVVQTTAAGRKVHERVKDQRSKAIAARLEKMPDLQAAQLLAALPALEALAAR
jgi:DNA-binding MarR family transcriptional regulator